MGWGLSVCNEFPVSLTRRTCASDPICKPLALQFLVSRLRCSRHLRLQAPRAHLQDSFPCHRLLVTSGQAGAAPGARLAWSLHGHGLFTFQTLAQMSLLHFLKTISGSLRWKRGPSKRSWICPRKGNMRGFQLFTQSQCAKDIVVQPRPMHDAWRTARVRGKSQ